MSHTLYATFANPEAAERAAGALLDRGVRAEDLSVVRQGDDAPPPRATASNVVAAPGSVHGAEPNFDIDPDDRPVTTDEVKADATKGALVGAGIGTLAALAAMVVPGVGLVIGAGALAAALGGIAATAGAGAAAGAIVGYLKDMGVDEDDATHYGQAIESGGAVLAVTVPSGEVGEETANEILGEHAATNVNRYAARGYVA